MVNEEYNSDNLGNSLEMLATMYIILKYKFFHRENQNIQRMLIKISIKSYKFSNHTHNHNHNQPQAVQHQNLNSNTLNNVSSGET